MLEVSARLTVIVFTKFFKIYQIHVVHKLQEYSCYVPLKGLQNMNVGLN